MNCINISNFDSNLNGFYKTSSENLLIFLCFFNRLTTYSSQGGVIYINFNPFFLQIFETTFYKCSASGYGGAIFVYVTSSILKKICSDSCFSNSGAYQFAYLSLNNDRLKTQDIELMTIISCYPNFQTGSNSFHLDYGNQSIYYLNSTKNHLLDTSSLGSDIPTFFLMNFCNIYNNSVLSRSIRIFSNSNHNISNSNIILNQSPNNYGIISASSTSINLKICIFNNNKNLLFYSSSSTIKVLNSFFNNNNNLGSFISISNNEIFTNSFFILHYSTFLCYNNYLLNFINKLKNYQFFYFIKILIFFTV